MIRGIHHVGITVRDLGDTIAFFTTLLECEVVSVEEFNRNAEIETLIGYDDVHADVAMLRVPGSPMLIELVAFRRPSPGVVDMETYNVGNTHLCFQVADIGKAFTRLKNAGTKFRSEQPVHETSGPYQDVKWAYLRNQDGITIELCELPEAMDSAS